MVTRVIDGDTVVCDLNLGLGLWVNAKHVRLVAEGLAVKVRDMEGEA